MLYSEGVRAVIELNWRLAAYRPRTTDLVTLVGGPTAVEYVAKWFINIFFSRTHTRSIGHLFPDRSSNQKYFEGNYHLFCGFKTPAGLPNCWWCKEKKLRFTIATQISPLASLPFPPWKKGALAPVEVSICSTGLRTLTIFQLAALLLFKTSIPVKCAASRERHFCYRRELDAFFWRALLP